MYGAVVERHWQGKNEVLGEKPIPVTLCLPQNPHWLTWNRTRTSEVTGRRPTASVMARSWSQLQMKTITHSSCKLRRSLQLQILRREQVLTRVNNNKNPHTRTHAWMRTSLKPIFILQIKINSDAWIRRPKA
jgi:hypothetical protein